MNTKLFHMFKKKEHGGQFDSTIPYQGSNTQAGFMLRGFGKAARLALKHLPLKGIA